MTQQFRISGRVFDRATGAGVAGIVVRAYDKDLLFDDLLGNALTDVDGRFLLVYEGADFRELFERRPDIYLSLHDGSGARLQDTRDAIRWRAGADEVFDVALDRVPPKEGTDTVGASLGLPPDSLKIERRGDFVLPRLAGFATGGLPGTPALPQQMRFVALPAGSKILSLDVRPGTPVQVALAGLPLPAQAPTPDEGLDPKTLRPLHAPRPTALDPRWLDGDERHPHDLVEFVRTETVGPLAFTALLVRPVQYDAKTRSYLFHPDLRYEVTFDATGSSPGDVLGEFQGEDLRAIVDSDRVTLWPHFRWPIERIEEVPHLIVTDNFSWPEKVVDAEGSSRAPVLAERGAALGGDVIGELQRLADWRSALGMRSRVVSISDIVSGRWGDFTQGGFARDLQEVIRNFLKHVHTLWKTSYVVLGGDVHVVPMRVLTGSGGYGTFGVTRTADNPPPRGRNRVDLGRSVVKLHPDFVPASGDPLSTYHGGIRIPYNREAGSGQLGWYFTTEADFLARESGFTRNPAAAPTSFVIVQGPAAILDDDYYWVKDENAIPSDFYYASLFGPAYSQPGQHDFDTNNNGLYGQSHWVDGTETSLDGIDFASDVWVGRIPLDSAAQAKAYVDKLITYEDLRVPGGAAVDVAYLRRIVYAADYWGRPANGRQADTTIAAAEGRFTHIAGQTQTRLHLDFDLTLSMGSPMHRLVARTGTAQSVIPYNTVAHAANLGWYFTTADDYATQSASPTRFVILLGPQADIDADWFFWDPVALEGAGQEKETLRTMMNGWWPAFTDVHRHYADYFDIAPPPALVPLEESTLRDELDAGAHFLSLTGHGWWGGCCGIDVAGRPDFANDGRCFIAYADSCSTGRPDGVDSAAEVSVVDANGGAVAYVGNTRYSWIGVGDNYEQVFWCMLKASGRAGPAAGLRLATDGVRSIWAMYAQTLYGDPALRVWDHVPRRLVVKHPDWLTWHEPLQIAVLNDNGPLPGARVTLLGEGIFVSAKTGDDGRVVLTLPHDKVPVDVQLTVSSRKGFDYRVRLGTARQIGRPAQPPDDGQRGAR
jgi:hypothetical protein